MLTYEFEELAVLLANGFEEPAVVADGFEGLAVFIVEEFGKDELPIGFLEVAADVGGLRTSLCGKALTFKGCLKEGNKFIPMFVTGCRGRGPKNLGTLNIGGLAGGCVIIVGIDWRIVGIGLLPIRKFRNIDLQMKEIVKFCCIWKVASITDA